MRLLIAGFILVLAAFGADKDSDTTKRLANAATVFEEIMGTADKSIPQKILDKSQCAVIVPGLKKGAFIVGAKYGRGFVFCRNANGTGWSAPGAVRVEGGSFGLQIGGSETDVVMLVMNAKGAERLLSNKFTIGADASAAAGPVGRTAQADTDATLRAEILTWSRARGVFAGVSLQGATLRQDGDALTDLYGSGQTNKQIVESGKPAPAAAQKVLDLLNKYSARKVS
ncbi:MAG: lipid-binding SYLF domain-containing protein [Bryobacterales bacterium]|nr:lipid-binding SYLF domain-containing protein [Bryobacterales bacterium]